MSKDVETKTKSAEEKSAEENTTAPAEKKEPVEKPKEKGGKKTQKKAASKESAEKAVETQENGNKPENSIPSEEKSTSKAKSNLIEGVKFIADEDAVIPELNEEMKRIINTMNDDEAQEFLGIKTEKEETKNSQNVSFDHRAIATQEDLEFYQLGYSNNATANEDEILNIFDSLKRVKHIVPATMIGCECQNITIKRNEGNIKRYIMYALLRLPAPYDIFPVYISFYDFFTEKERANFKSSHILSGRAYPERGTREEAVLQERLLSRHTGFTFEIIIEKIEKETNIITGSRVAALEKRFTQYFNRGIVINGKLQKPKKGSIIKGCPITRITRNNVRLDVCGVPVSVPMKEVSYRFISSPYDVFKPGDVADIYICDIKKSKAGNRPDDVNISASIKLAGPDPTAEALKKELSDGKILSNVLGKIVFVNPNRHCYHVYTEKGYNCIALSSKSSSLKETFGQLTSYTKEPKAGMKAIIRPYRIINNVMIGVILNCWW